MRVISEPRLAYQDVLETCVNSIDSDSLRRRITCIKANLITTAQEYKEKALLADLYLIVPFTGKKDDIVDGRVICSELKGLYSAQMVPAKKPARKIYDHLKLLAPNRICPFCGFGHVTTLDHYLPKARFPTVSVLPINLVPACTDCNTGKSTSVATLAREQCIHPYFDHGIFIDDQWIFAEVITTSPATFKFRCNPPAEWDAVNQARVEAHFTEFNLASRFGIQAANELSTLKGELQYDFDSSGMSGVKEELQKRASVAENLHKNSWKTAMYQALALNDWYCDGGFFQG